MTEKLNARDYRNMAKAIFDGLGIKKPNQSKIQSQIEPALGGLRPDEIASYSRDIASRLKQGSERQRAYMELVFAKSVLMARIFEEGSKQGDKICDQVKWASDKTYKFLSPDEGGYTPDGANGLIVLFAELPGLIPRSQAAIERYGQISKDKPESCQTVLGLIKKSIKDNWSASFVGLMDCYNKLDECADPAAVAQSK